MIVEEEDKITKEKTDEFAKDLHLSLLREGKPIYLNAWGMSMYPFIKSSDRIKVEPADEKDIKIGDIIAVNRKSKEGGWFFVHRVVKIEGHGRNRIYFTKGDFNKEGLDKPVTIDLIAGKITEIKRRALVINLKLPAWEFLNNAIAKFSLKNQKIVHILSRALNLIIERELFLYKVKNRLRKGSPILYNTEELLLICARKNLDERLKEKAIDLIKEGVQWERFTQSAMKNGSTILVYEALKGITPYVHIPQYAFDKLKFAYLFVVSKITSQHKDMMELLRLFAENDIPIIPLKGTLLSKRLYGDIAMRGLNVDFDFLIEEKNKERAEILLEEAGYSLNPDVEIKKWQWQHIFSRPKATMIDLHWDITMMCRNKERLDGLWKGTQLAEEEGIRYYEFKEEELLLYLSVHLVNSSSFNQLRYVSDINELLNRYRIALVWSSIIEKARRWKVSNSLYTALNLSKSLFNSDVPLEALQALRPNFLKLILIETFANRKVILRGGVRRRLMNTFLSYIFFELIETRSFSEYLAIVKRVLLPPREVLPDYKNGDSKHSFARYTVRFFKGFVKVLRKIFFVGRRHS